MSLLFWVILCVLACLIVDLIPVDSVVNKVVKVLAVIGLGVCLFLAAR